MVTEAPASASPPGVRRRQEHIARWLEERGAQVDWLPLDETICGSRRKRYVRWRQHVSRVRLKCSGYQYVVVIGLGAPHMLRLAYAVAATVPVLFDACDSWLLQCLARLRSRLWPTAIIALFGAALQFGGGRTLTCTYISKRDARWDKVLNFGRQVTVIPPATPELKLSAPSYPLHRVVLAGDFASFHNQPGLKTLLRAAQLLERESSIQFELFGPSAPSIQLPGNVKYCGWASTLEEIYSEDCCVVVTNRLGSGVPNKILEAAGSGRRYAVHRSLKRNEYLQGERYFYSDAASLARTIIEMCGVRA
ncbi:glycosyltransferase [Micromonospora chersina]|uniref:glycosyltransferase n=1 Tax=Micromonospora chersina TaxID=47854 RepID=UPI003716B929